MMKLVNNKGFSLIEILVVCVVIAILATILVPRFLGTKDRARVGAAVADLDQFRRALGMYEVDNQDYPSSDYNSVAALSAILIDHEGIEYMTMPDGRNFGSFAYDYNLTPPPAYTITATALDQGHTTLLCTPEGITRQ
jgi:prepilin-type N-terminal cleavage/methylation domain-containing protein